MLSAGSRIRRSGRPEWKSGIVVPETEWDVESSDTYIQPAQIQVENGVENRSQVIVTMRQTFRCIDQGDRKCGNQR